MATTTRTPPVISFKRGDTLRLGCAAKTEEGLPIDLYNYTVTSQVRTISGDLVSTLESQWIDRTQGTFELRVPGDGRTTGWPVGNLEIDIQYNYFFDTDQVVRSSETFFIRLLKDVTV
jgi:hypothetical protein